ncbi:MAG: ATP-binding cassette domain-containing protein [Planctomycetes bacterium]|nr:ATP-binding cassette domain-containing protein [Planctomycetota bacterium]
MNTESAYIEIADLAVWYPDRDSSDGRLNVLDGLSLSIPQGAFTSVIGPNGCGKTTLLLCLAGLLPPNRGSVRIAGASPGDTLCGYVFQNYRDSLFPWLTVLDNISFPLTVQRVSGVNAILS